MVVITHKYNINYVEDKGNDIVTVTKKVARTRTVTTPDVGEYVYADTDGVIVSEKKIGMS